MGTIAEKLTYLNGTKQNLKTVINYTGANITSETTFRDYAILLYDGYVDILKNKYVLLDNLPRSTGTGTSINITHAEDLPLYSFKLTKESTQDTTTGKNLLKTSLEIMKEKNTAGTWNNNVYTYRQVDFTVNDDLSITITGTATGGRADFFLFGGTTDTGDYMYIPQGTYSVYKTGLVDGTLFISWREKTAGVKYTTSSNNSAIETMANQDCYFYGVMLGLENDRTLNQFNFYPMLVSGSTLGNYEQYTGGIPSPNPDYPQEVKTIKTSVNIVISDGTNSETITIPLGTNEIVGIGNYKDELIIDKTGHCYLNKKIGKVVYTGSESENWSYLNDYDNNYLFQAMGVTIPIPNNSTDYLCSHTLPNSTSYSSGTLGSYVFNNIFRIRIPSTIATTSGDFKTWLSTHNISVYYVLETSTLIDLDYTVDTTLFKGTNTITNSETATMEISYITDLTEIL